MIENSGEIKGPERLTGLPDILRWGAGDRSGYVGALHRSCTCRRATKAGESESGKEPSRNAGQTGGGNGDGRDTCLKRGTLHVLFSDRKLLESAEAIAFCCGSEGGIRCVLRWLYHENIHWVES